MSRAVRTASFRGEAGLWPSVDRTLLFAVPQHGIGVHADIQLDLHDVVDRPLVRMPAIPRSYAAGVPSELLGCDK